MEPAPEEFAHWIVVRVLLIVGPGEPKVTSATDDFLADGQPPATDGTTGRHQRVKDAGQEANPLGTHRLRRHYIRRHCQCTGG